MTSSTAEIIDASRRAAVAASRPNVATMLFALLCFCSAAFMVYREEKRSDAQIAVLAAMQHAISDLDEDLRASGVPKLHRQQSAAYKE